MVTIRPIREEDARSIAELMGELGYPASPESMRGKINEIMSDHAGGAFVAEDGQHVMGVVSVHVIPLLHAIGKLGRITALVVHSANQRAGVGRDLVQTAEAFARDHGCTRMEVTSSHYRAGAHEFYKRVGYEQTPHGRFVKDV